MKKNTLLHLSLALLISFPCLSFSMQHKTWSRGLGGLLVKVSMQSRLYCSGRVLKPINLCSETRNGDFEGYNDLAIDLKRLKRTSEDVFFEEDLAYCEQKEIPNFLVKDLAFFVET